MSNDFKIKDVVLLDACLPGYFQGYSYPVYAVPLWHGITYRELKQALIEEYNQVELYHNGIIFDEEHYKDILDFINFAFLPVKNMDEVFFKYSDYDENFNEEELDENAYAYFGVKLDEGLK